MSILEVKQVCYQRPNLWIRYEYLETTIRETFNKIPNSYLKCLQKSVQNGDVR